MATPVTMPQLGESVTEGTITRWLKAEGDEIERDEPLAEVDTDKVNAELPSPLAGKIEKRLVSEGATVDVGVEIALVAVDGEPLRRSHAPRRHRRRGPRPKSSRPPAPKLSLPRGREREAGAPSPGKARNAPHRRDGRTEDAETLKLKRSSPVVRRLAGEHGVDIAEVAGTGAGGRAANKDIEGYIKGRSRPRGPRGEGARDTRAGRSGGRSRHAAGARARTGVRGRPGRGAHEHPAGDSEPDVESKREIPHAWTMVEADVTGPRGVERAGERGVCRAGGRQGHVPAVYRGGGRRGPQAASRPELGVGRGDRQIVQSKRINIGVAVDLEDALIVPVIPDADELNILGLARKIAEAVKKARGSGGSPRRRLGGHVHRQQPGRWAPWS